ncbi:uncharacterized protein LOC124418983 [Lucilia cuprina]|uniref:uncharacterized protein LOC124418983 n=1 Tax=Lucilia cuprina TaxID=7375 RepID=UPI001F0677CB|nr:uncharacterized protein LOC124418983 [Lucilia cuprina]
MLRYLQKEKASGDDGANQDDGSGSSTLVADKRKKRKIKEDWLTNPDINSWAEKRDSKVFCKICNVELKVSSGKSDLMAHLHSKKHQDAANATQQTKINEVFNIDYSPKKVAEIKLALFIVEHNLPFAVSDHLTKVCHNSFKDSNTAASITLGRTKANAIIKNIVGAKQFQDVTNLLKTNSFSLCVDESTDLTNVKSLCLVVRLCINFEIRDFFYGLLTVEHADANSLYQLIVNHFNKNGVNYKKNMIGFAADGAAVMTGRNKSVAQLLKNENNDLFIIKCVCHSLALCSSYACLKLPSSVETLARSIYNYISNSPKRNNQFQNILSLLDIKPKKILHPCQTRWLSLEVVVIRLIELYEPLKIYFAFAVNIDKIDTAQYILDNLNFENKIYLCFLKYILGIINNINKMFQSETTEIQNLYDQMQKLLKTVLSNFIKLDLLKNDKFYLLNYKDEQNILDYNEVYLGVYAREELLASGLEETEKHKIVHNCINFYVELCDQILVRFDFGEKFQALSLINPYYYK